MKRIGYTTGVFDLFHIGHLNILKRAKLECDYLIVGLQTDPTLDRPEKNRPIQTTKESRDEFNASWKDQ